MNETMKMYMEAARMKAQAKAWYEEKFRQAVEDMEGKLHPEVVQALKEAIESQGDDDD